MAPRGQTTNPSPRQGRHPVVHQEHNCRAEPDDQPLSTSGLSSSRPPRTRLSSRTRQPTSLHIGAVIQSSTKNTTVEQNPTTNPSTATNGTPIKSFDASQIELQLGLQPGVSSSPTSCSLNPHQIIRHPPNQPSTGATSWRFIIAGSHRC